MNESERGRERDREKRDAVQTSTHNLLSMLKRGTTGAVAGDPRSTLDP